MHLAVLAVPGCPNVAALEQRLAAVLDGRAGVSVSRHVIRDEGQAARWACTARPLVPASRTTRSRAGSGQWWDGKGARKVVPASRAGHPAQVAGGDPAAGGTSW